MVDRINKSLANSGDFRGDIWTELEVQQRLEQQLYPLLSDRTKTALVLDLILGKPISHNQVEEQFWSSTEEVVGYCESRVEAFDLDAFQSEVDLRSVKFEADPQLQAALLKLDSEIERRRMLTQEYFKLRDQILSDLGMVPDYTDQELWPELARRRQSARQILVKSNTRLIWHTLRQLPYYFSDRERNRDLLAEGELHLLRLIDHYNPARGYKLSTFVVTGLSNHFQNIFKNGDRNGFIPGAPDLGNVRNNKNREVFNSVIEIGEKTDIISPRQWRGKGDLELDAESSEGSAYHELIADSAADFVSVVEFSERQRFFLEVLGEVALNLRQEYLRQISSGITVMVSDGLKVWLDSYGMEIAQVEGERVLVEAEKRKTKLEIAKEYGVSGSAIASHVNKVNRRIREIVEKRCRNGSGTILTDWTD